jgi:hypothetical protein
MASTGMCERCDQLLREPTVVEAMNDRHHTWPRSLHELLRSSNSGCRFCSLLNRSFGLEKFVQTTRARQPDTSSDIPMNFELKWSSSSLQRGQISFLHIAVEGLGRERNLTDWGLDGLLFATTARRIFKIMTLEGEVFYFYRLLAVWLTSG